MSARIKYIHKLGGKYKDCHYDEEKALFLSKLYSYSILDALNSLKRASPDIDIEFDHFYYQYFGLLIVSNDIYIIMVSKKNFIILNIFILKSTQKNSENS